MTSGRGPRRDRRDIRTLRRENAALRAENLALREHCLATARARRQAARDRAQLDEILGSRAWAIVQGARRVAAIVGWRGTFRADGPARPASPHVLQQIGDGLGETSPRPAAKVSVIVPNYNHAPYLEERLRSVFAQTYPPHEILFLDDASTDDGVAVARRLAAESPVPFRLVLNESNGGSTFRQWLKGIELARGDLIWIAESDDTCRPEFLERLVPSFDDPGVMLAYCQSSMIGPEGQTYAPDYLEATDDLSPVRWRHPYCVTGCDEVERALSQRNTIPNASAVVFRKPAELEERTDLQSLRLGGDWLFYATRIRRGKIAYLPDPLNGHRHHDRTVRGTFERNIELFEEQLRVKARIFESFPVSSTAISGSLARGFAEYAERMQVLEPRRAMTEHPLLVPHLDRIRAAFDARAGERPDSVVLVVLSGVTDRPEDRAAIRMINAMSRRSRVFLCNACPDVLDPANAVRVDERVILLEGGLGLRPWSSEGDAISSRHAEVIRELVRFHRIDAIHAMGDRAEALLAAAGAGPAIARLDLPNLRRKRRTAAASPRRGVTNRPLKGPESAPGRRREIALASRIHRLVLALRDTRKRLAHVERVAADYAGREASPAWRLAAAIDRISRWIAPERSLRRRALAAAVRALRRPRFHRTDEAGLATPESTPEITVIAGKPPSPEGGGRVLILDHTVPTPDLDAGSVRMIEIIKAIRNRGHSIVFIPEVAPAPDRSIELLAGLGVEVVRPLHHESIAGYLREHGPGVDLAILSRAGVASQHLQTVKGLAPRARTVFDTVDLHYLREWREARLLGDRERVWEARRRKWQELEMVRRSDATLVVSTIEREILRRECPGADIRVLSTIVEVPDEDPPGWEGRRDAIFIGGFRHAPNVDAVVHFIEDILPHILRRSPELVFQVVGPDPPERISALAGDHVRVLGHVPDLTPVLRRTLVSVAPLRFGAGVKGKINLSMAHGVPTVISPVAAEGMHLVHRHDTMIAGDPVRFAEAVLEVIRSRELWERLASNGRASVRAHFSVQAVASQIDHLLALAGLGREADRTTRRRDPDPPESPRPEKPAQVGRPGLSSQVVDPCGRIYSGAFDVRPGCGDGEVP